MPCIDPHDIFILLSLKVGSSNLCMHPHDAKINTKTIKQNKSTVALVHIKSIEQSQCSYGFITHAIHPTPPKKKKIGGNTRFHQRELKNKTKLFQQKVLLRN